jgi:hypothetical protein
MPRVDELKSKEIIRNIHTLNQLQDIFHKLEVYYSKHVDSMKQPTTRGGPLHTLCEYVDNLNDEEVYNTLFAKSKEELRIAISTLVVDLNYAAEEYIHKSVYGSFGVISSDFVDKLWMRNTRTLYKGKDQRHY